LPPIKGFEESHPSLIWNCVLWCSWDCFFLHLHIIFLHLHNFQNSIIDMSKLQNYLYCYKRRFSMKGVRCISEQRWMVSQRFLRCWSGGLKALWVAVGGYGWLKNNHRCLRRGICYSFFLISMNCKNRRSSVRSEKKCKCFYGF